VVQDLFLTETAQVADVVLPAACAYEKNGTVTNVTGEVQRLARAVNTMGAKPDLEIMGFLAREMGAAAALGRGRRKPCSKRFARCAANAGIPGAAQPPVDPIRNRIPTTTGCSRPARSGAILRY
jgi:anaerobic selenocysteine-containing dehydrogenase